MHELSLINKDQAAVVTYDIIGRRMTRVLPLSRIVRRNGDSERIMINDRLFLLPKGGEMLDKEAFERAFRVRT